MNDEKTTQENMDLGTTTGDVDSVEKYQFAPIKGYPMLNWRGKRPFSSTQYFPAQLKEVHGEEVDGWRNKIFWGDNLQVMSRVEQTMNDCAGLRIPSTFPPVGAPCPTAAMRVIARKLSALCPLLLPQCFHVRAR